MVEWRFLCTSLVFDKETCVYIYRYPLSISNTNESSLWGIQPHACGQNETTDWTKCSMMNT